VQISACSAAIVVVFSACSAALAAPIPSHPNDPDFDLQWSLHNTGQVIAGIAGTPEADIDLLAAWAIHPGGGNVTVAIVGTGVNPHPEFSERLLSGFVSPGVGGDPFSTLDTASNGTHVAGIIAASANNAAGVVGVNPFVKILPVRVIDGTASSPAFIADGIIWAVDNGATIIAIPIRLASSSSALADAIAYAAANDVLCVAPTGRSNELGVAFPAAYDGCIAVASTTNTDQRAPFSNYGPEVELAAPGQGIYSTALDNGYDFEPIPSGQSATALVAGVASLIRSYAPQLSATEVRQILKDSANDLGDNGWDQFFGAGRVNARRALDQTPPLDLRIAWETGVPLTILPNGTSTAVVVIANEAETLDPTSPELTYRILPDGTEISLPLTNLGGDRFVVPFPALPCHTEIEFYITATGDSGTTVSDPPRAPDRLYTATVISTQVVFHDDFESDMGWQSQVVGSPATGEWVRVDPVGTFTGTTPVQPEYDASTNEKTMCAVTGQHTSGSIGQNDVDGGPVSLTSPTIILATDEAEISYWRWVFSQSGNIDALIAEFSLDDGATWFVVEQATSTAGWQRHKFLISDFPEAVGDELRIRFTIGDVDNDSLTEAAIDEVLVEAIRCDQVPGDYNADGVVDQSDYAVLAPCIAGPAQAILDPTCNFFDAAGNNTVDLRDVSTFLTQITG
jgi:Subtilase family